MTSKRFIQTLFIISFLVFGAWIVYGTVFPERLYKLGQKISKIQIVASTNPYFHFTGLDEPHYYVIESQNSPIEFRISGEVLDLVQDNDSILRAVKEIKSGDTLLLYVAMDSIGMLNQSSGNVKIIGLANKTKTLIDPDKIEKYYIEHKSNNRFSLFVIAIILFFLIRQKIKTKESE